jgi:threonine dehydratase
MSTTTDTKPAFDFKGAAERLKGIAVKTPLQYNLHLSRRYNCNVYLKREDMQVVRSYKLRGAYNLMKSLPNEQLQKGVVCASAGNHAQGFAYSCKTLNVKGVVFMPVITPNQKINQTKMFGEDNIEIKLFGDNYDECAVAAKDFTKANHMTFIHPFDDPRVIEGQATVGVEKLKQFNNEFTTEDKNNIYFPPLGSDGIDYLFVPVGGGGLASGVGTYFRTYSPKTKIIGVEPEGAPSMYKAFEAGKPVTLNCIDTFVDGASVKRTGDLTYSICKEVLDDLRLIPEGRICTNIIKLYTQDAIVAEPAGALSISALDDFTDEIKGKNVVCVVSGGNNDIDRMQEIKERSLQYEGLKHYFLIRFAQRPGALKEFVNNVLGPDDDITRFEYIQKHNKETGPALVGIELKKKEDYDLLLDNLKKFHFHFTELKKDDNMFGYVV